MAPGAVARPREPELAEEAHEHPGMGTLVAEADGPVGALDHDGVAHVARAQGVEVALHGQADHLAASAFGLPLDPREPQVCLCRAGEEPLQVVEGLQPAALVSHELEV